VPAGRLFTVAVVPTSVPEAFFQEYFTVPLAPVTAPALIEPVAPQPASVLVDVARARLDEVAVIVTELVLLPQSSLTVKVYTPAGRLFNVAAVPTSVPEAFFQEYFTVPLAPVTAPALTDPVAPQPASVLPDAARARLDEVAAIVTELFLLPQSSLTVKV